MRLAQRNRTHVGSHTHLCPQTHLSPAARRSLTVSALHTPHYFSAAGKRSYDAPVVLARTTRAVRRVRVKNNSATITVNDTMVSTVESAASEA